MNIQYNIPLHSFTTLRTGGEAEYFCRIHNQISLVDACEFAEKKTLPLFILGGGSNVLISDEGFFGLVIKIELKGIEYFEKENGSVEVVVGAGESWDDFVSDSVKQELYGIENLSRIPGTVGATPIQNIGAYGAEVKDTIVWVEAYDIREKTFIKIKNNKCNFKYRDSFFKTKRGKDFIITKVCFVLQKKGTLNTSYKDVQNYFKNKSSEAISLLEMRKAIVTIRKEKFPDLSVVGTVGSFFKNPIVSKQVVSELQCTYPELPCFKASNGDVKVSLAWILDHILKWKGVRRGKVGTFSNQPLVIVNYGKENADEIKMFTNEIKKDVKKKINIKIISEVTVIKN